MSSVQRRYEFVVVGCRSRPALSPLSSFSVRVFLPEFCASHTPLKSIARAVAVQNTVAAIVIDEGGTDIRFAPWFSGSSESLVVQNH